MRFAEAGQLQGGDYREFREGDLRIATSLETRPGADRLTLVLNGYCDRGTAKPPVFVLWPASAPAFGHILRVSDPTLLMAEWLRGSCFLGREHADPVPPIVDIAHRFARDLGVSTHNIIYLGHSGAGFGALQCGIRDSDAATVVINPVAEIGAYSGYQFAARLAQVFRPGSIPDDICAEFPERMSVSASLRRALKAGAAPRIGLIQNVTDKTHFQPHYGAVCATLGLPVTSGSDPSGQFHGVTYDLKGGHSMPPDMSLIEAMADRVIATPVNAHSGKLAGTY